MARLIIDNMFCKALEVQTPSPTLLEVLKAHRIDWMHACGGKGRCGTCRVQIIKGQENMAPLNEVEQRIASKLMASERLACQAKLLGGDVVVKVPRNCQLPKVAYRSEKEKGA